MLLGTQVHRYTTCITLLQQNAVSKYYTPWYTDTQVHQIYYSPTIVDNFKVLYSLVHRYTGTPKVSLSYSCKILYSLVHRYTTDITLLQKIAVVKSYTPQVHRYTTGITLLQKIAVVKSYTPWYTVTQVHQRYQSSRIVCHFKVLYSYLH